MRASLFILGFRWRRMRLFSWWALSELGSLGIPPLSFGYFPRERETPRLRRPVTLTLAVSHRGRGELVCCGGMNPLRAALRLLASPLLLRKKGSLCGELCQRRLVDIDAQPRLVRQRDHAILRYDVLAVEFGDLFERWCELD